MGGSDSILLAIDQGTSSSRSIAFSARGTVLALNQHPFEQIYPASGWVEHDPEVIWATTLSSAREVLRQLRAQPQPVAAIGVTNQRETTLLWDRRTGIPVYNAIVWQDRRTADQCRQLQDAGHEDEVIEKTGLRLDPYFSATKLTWILDQVPGARASAESGHLAFGTVDSFLIWRLTGGRLHATDVSNASRTALFDIRKGRWDEALCELFRVPMKCLPEVRDSAGDFGVTDKDVFGEALPIRGVAGDQQAALVGQACFSEGDVKSTYGTGAFLVLNTGRQLLRSQNRLLSTVAYRLNGETTYALEGSILSAGSTIQWLRDGLGIISRAPEIELLAQSVTDSADYGQHTEPRQQQTEEHDEVAGHRHQAVPTAFDLTEETAVLLWFGPTDLIGDEVDVDRAVVDSSSERLTLGADRPTPPGVPTAHLRP